MHIEYAEYAEYLPIVFLVQLELAIGHGPRWVCSMYVLCTYIEHALLVHEHGVSLGGGRCLPLPPAEPPTGGGKPPPPCTKLKLL